jgi:hypothetical protein
MKQPGQKASNRGELIAQIGTILSAVLATSCCWVPLLILGLGFLGVSTGGFARIMKTGMESYRTTFMAVTFAFLGLAFYLAYRPRRAAAGGAADC